MKSVLRSDVVVAAHTLRHKNSPLTTLLLAKLSAGGSLCGGTVPLVLDWDQNNKKGQ